MAMLSRLRPYAYAALRIVAGFLFVFHGLQKLFGWFGGQQVPIASLFGAAGIIEAVAGTLIAVGLWTQPTAFLASGEMAVAYFMAHQPKGTWPIENQGELAALYCFIFLYIAASGAGPLSIDSLRGRGRRRF
jgi:putative oxidoreductase